MSKILDRKLKTASLAERRLWALRHTAEHVLHTAMQSLYPSLKKAMGPATPEGFYFDFDLDQKISEADFPRIEKEMQRLIDADLPLKQESVSVQKARRIFRQNPYKLEWIDSIKERGEKISLYKMGEADLDLCSGPHVQKTGEIKAFKLLSVAGAYWRGSEKNKMLTRIYGTAFPRPTELTTYLQARQAAEAKDHRKIGKELELFTISEEVGPGLVLWLPKGNLVKEELEKWAKETEKAWGYLRVTTPHITKAGLYYTSGHLPYYQKDMFPPMKLEGDVEYFLKPMNCPHHHLIYLSKPRSYRDLPLRLAEYGTCYRYEASGELFGLLRVRGFTQNDSHIYCRVDQAVEEFIKVLQLHEYYYNTLGFTKNDYYLLLSLPDESNRGKYHGDKKMWDKAERLMRLAIKETGITYKEDPGGAAFYGPKIDFNIRSVTGRDFGASTNQLDLYMPTRFDLKYTNQSGRSDLCAVIHRAPLGSHERFIGFLIEHFAGAFPVWLSPIQVKLLPLSDKLIGLAQQVKEKLETESIRVELDDRQETLGAKIRHAQLLKIPYMVVLGPQEARTGKLAVRLRDGRSLGDVDPSEFIRNARRIILTKSLNLW